MISREVFIIKLNILIERQKRAEKVANAMEKFFFDENRIDFIDGKMSGEFIDVLAYGFGGDGEVHYWIKDDIDWYLYEAMGQSKRMRTINCPDEHKKYVINNFGDLYDYIVEHYLCES